VRGVRVMSRGFVIAGIVMLSGLTVVACCVFMMHGCLIVVVCCFLRHVGSPWDATDWASRPKARMNVWP
jgi:hypothetical protein